MAGDQEQKDRIVKAAQGLFGRFGLEKTTMEDIASAAKKGKSSIYYYFPSKEDIFAEVINQEIIALKARIKSEMDLAAAPGDKLKAFGRARLAYLAETEDRYTAIKAEYLRAYPYIEEILAGYGRWEVRTIRSIIEAGQARGLFGAGDATALSQAVFFALKGLEYPWLTGMPPAEMAATLDVLIEVILSGLNG